jgi:uncharacterized membrane protein
MMGISWGKFQSTFVTVVITILIIWILKEINDRYNIPVIGQIIAKGA